MFYMVISLVSYLIPYVGGKSIPNKDCLLHPVNRQFSLNGHDITNLQF